MALTFFWRCEGTTLRGTDDYVESGGDTTPTAGGTPSIAAGGAIVGSNGIIAGTGANYRFDTTTAVFDPTVGSFGMLFRINTFNNSARPLMIRGTTAANQYSLQLVGADEIKFMVGNPDGSNVSATTTSANLVVDTDYGIVCRWDQPNSHLVIELYSTPLGTPALLQSVDAGAFTAPTELAAADRFRLGENGGVGGSFDIDNVFVSKTYAEPIESNFAITSYTSYNSGSTSVTKTPAQAVLTVNVLAPLTNAYTFVAIQDTLISESGQAVANAANIRLLVWYSGQAIGAPDYSVNGQTSNASGSISWSVTPGSLANGQAIFYLAQDSISYSNYTCGRVVPTYG